METNLMDTELMKLEKMGESQKTGGLAMPLREFQDHKLVTLYTALNKPIGPMTIMNAKQTMVRWAKKGIELYTEKRSEAQVAEYKKGPKYKRLHEKWRKEREDRHKASKKQDVNEMAKQIAKETGKAVAEELNKKPDTIKNTATVEVKETEGRKKKAVTVGDS